MGTYQRSVTYLVITPSPRRNIYGTHDVQGPSCPPTIISLFVRLTKRRKRKPLNQVALKVSSDHHIDKGHTIFSRKFPTKSPYFYIYLGVPSLPSLCFFIHCSEVFPPHNLVYFTELFTFSALFQNFRVAYPHVFCWIGLSKLQKKKKATQRMNLFCFHSQSMKQMQNIWVNSFNYLVHCCPNMI